MSAADAPTLTGADLVLGFGRRLVVQSVSARLRSGVVTALIGPNGSGKSTLLRALARLHSPAGGRVELTGGVPAASLSAREFARAVTLFTQTRSAPQGLSVREVVTFGRHPHRRALAGPSAADRAAVDEAMRRTGVASMADRAAGELSGGELQRVWLAACLAQQTGTILLDEPTNHLDLRYQMEVLDLIRDLADVEGAAIGVVLHDLDHAAHVADHLLLLHEGRILAEGPPAEVLTAEHLGAAYGLRVDVSRDVGSGRLRIDPVSRRSERMHDAHRPRPDREEPPA
ncbi:ABC transporter ATP-binding protein [Arenivirga flava]|uniref:ABC transporter ATP-binding protein n=1 Tax=Arenivirga flava TaxID=1930060 RepID=A0AA37XBF7_9MICO|nr:ABC transporter ATP-binding protein [Arenivirga flava]GMA28693.1 ABC transporter ATP-binding protein [Arenivirga flava]